MSYTPCTLAAFATKKRLDPARLADLHVCDDVGGLHIPCLSNERQPTGTVRVRHWLETAHPTTWIGPPMVYGLHALPLARTKGELVIVEGESDQFTLDAHGIPALGVPGATMTKYLAAEHFNGIARVFVVRESDRAGTQFVAGVKQRLIELSWSGELRIVDLNATLGLKDTSDVHVLDPERFEEHWSGAIAAAELLEIESQPEPPSSNDAAPSADEAKRKSQAKKLLELFNESGAKLLRDRTGTGYVRMPEGALYKLYTGRNGVGTGRNGVGGWLRKRYYDEHDGNAPGAQALIDAIATLEARALHSADTRAVDVALRIAGSENTFIDVDLGDDGWRMARITPQGCSIMSHADGDRFFRRTPGMLPLPEPEHGGTLNDLKAFFHVDNASWSLIAAWMLSAMHPSGPYPLLLFACEHGSAKSSAGRALRDAIDPNVCKLRKPPKDDRDLFIGASNAWILAFDNLSSIPDWLSDGLCSISTGGGFLTRTLHSDEDETIFVVKRPVLVTSIADVATRPDLLDRTMIVRLKRITDDERRAEADLYADYQKVWPRIFGALLDAASTALAKLPETKQKITGLPRMADFARWVIAGESAFGVPEGTFLTAYSQVQGDAHALGLEASPIVDVLRDHLGAAKTASPWQGTAGELLEGLEGRASEKVRQRREWPKSAKSLADKLRRMAPSLRATGVDIELDIRESHTGRRLIKLELQPAPPENRACDAGYAGDAASGISCGDSSGSNFSANGEPRRCPGPCGGVGIPDEWDLCSACGTDRDT